MQPSEHPTIHLSNFTINLSGLSFALKTKNSSLRSDPIPNFVLSSCPDILAPMVTQLFTVRMKARKKPNLWKCSIITPVYKSRNPESIKNYQLISILNQLPLIFEELLFRHMYPQVPDSICHHQDAFTKKCSPVTQFLPYLDVFYTKKILLLQTMLSTCTFEKLLS